MNQPESPESYVPQPLDTRRIEIGPDIAALTEQLARNTHEVWSMQRMSDGWTYGPKRDDQQKHHPCLIPYEDLPESEKQYDRNTALETLKLIIALGYRVAKEDKLAGNGSR